jgi:hypothetical protein
MKVEYTKAFNQVDAMSRQLYSRLHLRAVAGQPLAPFYLLFHRRVVEDVEYEDYRALMDVRHGVNGAEEAARERLPIIQKNAVFLKKMLSGLTKDEKKGLVHELMFQVEGFGSEEELNRGYQEKISALKAAVEADSGKPEEEMEHLLREVFVFRFTAYRLNMPEAGGTEVSVSASDFERIRLADPVLVVKDLYRD